MNNGDKDILRAEEISDVVINSLPGVFYVQAKTGNYLRWNKNFEKVSGYTADEIRRSSPLQFFDAKDHVRIINVITRVFEIGEGEIEIETVTKSGLRIPYYFNGKAVNYEGQECLIGMGIYISERINAEKKIKENQERLNYHINNNPLAVIEYDRDLRVTFWSKRAKDLFGWTEEEVIGKKVTEFLVHVDDAVIVTESLLLLPQYNISERVPLANRNYTRDGKELHCRWHNSFLTDEEGNIETIMSIIRDITDLRKAELQREEMANDLIKRNNELEQFTYIVSHNLGSPVASLIGLADVLAEYDMDEAERKEIIKGISSSATRLDGVIRDLNDILHLKSGLSENREMVSFSTLITEIEQSMPEYFSSHKFVIETDFPVQEHYTQKNYLSSIFSNLITNSIKYRQPDVPAIIKIKSELRDQKLILTFKDNGLGFDLTKTGNDVFGLYKRFHFHVEGKGLGLFIVKTQVEMLGGRISLSSEVNKGSEFTIEFTA